jgi:hypothetical protein
MINMDFCSSITHYKFLNTLLLFFIVSCFLTGCEKTNQNTVTIKEAIKKYDQATQLEGVVSNNDGLIKVGAIKVTDNNGQLIASAAVQNNGHYRVEIPANTVLPIVLSFYPAAADTPKLITAVVHPAITKYDINPLTTSIAKKALAMGGYTHAHLVRAAESAANVPDANKTTAGFRGDPTTQYGGWH